MGLKKSNFPSTCPHQPLIFLNFHFQMESKITPSFDKMTKTLILFSVTFIKVTILIKYMSVIFIKVSVRSTVGGKAVCSCPSGTFPFYCPRSGCSWPEGSATSTPLVIGLQSFIQRAFTDEHILGPQHCSAAWRQRLTSQMPLTDWLEKGYLFQ